MMLVPAGSARGEDDGSQPADMGKRVQVYIMMGEGNMVGHGWVGDNDRWGSLYYTVMKDAGESPFGYLLDDEGNWTVRQDVRYARVQSSGTGPMTVYNNEWLTVGGGVTSDYFGVEVGIGHYLGNDTEAPVLLIKSCYNNRALGWDLLPPGSEQYSYDSDPNDADPGYTFPGSGGSPEKWETGTTPEPIGWYAGKQYDGDTRNVKSVLDNLSTYYPGATGYDIAGFFWWQGDRDTRTEGHAIRYEQNLVRLIEALREDFNAPHAKFVCATLGQTELGVTGGNEGLILDAQMAISDPTKYPEFVGDVASVYTHPMLMNRYPNGTSTFYYSSVNGFFMDVGEAMGQAMVDLEPVPEPMTFSMLALGGVVILRRRA